MRVGAASPACLHVAVLLGVRDGGGYRRLRGIQVANVRSLEQPSVAEVELDPGEYHVLAYQCMTDRGLHTLDDKSDGTLYRTSYAGVTLAAGEIVNVGYLHLGASHVGRSAFGRPLRIEISVTDWPVAELERYRQTRPALYAQMSTRLMTVNPQNDDPAEEADCGRLRALQTEGKVQRLPAACEAKPAATARKV